MPLFPPNLSPASLRVEFELSTAPPLPKGFMNGEQKSSAGSFATPLALCRRGLDLTSNRHHMGILMATPERTRELYEELGRIADEQEAADKQHRKDIDAARRTGDNESLQRQTWKYVSETNERGRQSKKVADELAS
jgi:hypothetical protein